jgi:CHRD domain
VLADQEGNVRVGSFYGLAETTSKNAPLGADGAEIVALEPTDVIGPASQGIAAGEFDELVRAIRAGVTYANVHSEKFPGGEIRGQIKGGSD